MAKVPWAKIKFLSFWCLFLQWLIADTINEQTASKSYGENLESTDHTWIDNSAPSRRANIYVYDCLSIDGSTAGLFFLLVRLF